MQEVIFWGIWAVLGLIMLLYYLRRKRRVLSLLVGAGSGLLALLVHYGGSLVGISPVLNPLHLVQSAVLGVPGVILMVVLHFTL
jgi:hypothetical protein